MLKQLLNELREADQVTAVTLRSAKTGQEMAFTRQADGIAFSVGGEAVALLRETDRGLEAEAVPGRVYREGSWNCYADCIRDCGSNLYCAKGCAEACGVY